MRSKEQPTGTTCFCDTSVIIAAADLRHVHHEASIAIVRTATPRTASCSAHTVAEIYSVLTSAAYRGRLRLAEVAEILNHVRDQFNVVGLTSAEYFRTVRTALLLGAQSGQIYDALHLAAAEKSEAEIVYTWNIKHFQAVAPAGMADRIRRP